MHLRHNRNKIGTMKRRNRYTAEELNARLRFAIGVILGLTLAGTMFAVLYSLIFVTQPLNTSAPNDDKFFQLISPVATFLTGTLAGLFLNSGDMKKNDAEVVETPVEPKK